MDTNHSGSAHWVSICRASNPLKSASIFLPIDCGPAYVVAAATTKLWEAVDKEEISALAKESTDVLTERDSVCEPMKWPLSPHHTGVGRDAAPPRLLLSQEPRGSVPPRRSRRHSRTGAAHDPLTSTRSPSRRAIALVLRHCTAPLQAATSCVVPTI